MCWLSYIGTLLSHLISENASRYFLKRIALWATRVNGAAVGGRWRNNKRAVRQRLRIRR